jgi:hypothetical protein
VSTQLEPSTPSGRDLVERWPYSRDSVRAVAVAIEQEAIARYAEGLVERVTRIPKTSIRDGSPAGTWMVEWEAVLAVLAIPEAQEADR